MSEHQMRITTGGSVSSYVAFALTFLAENPESRLVLHTRPADNNSGASSSENGEEKAKGKSKGLSASTLAAPRLIAVVEKIKRAHPGTLHQYTQSGLLAPVDEERPGLERVLAGKTKPKMTHRPFLQITLSARPLGLERRRNVTMQRSDARPTAPGSAAQILEKEEETEPVRAQAEAQAGAGAGEPVAAQRRGKRKSEAADAPAKRVRT